MPILPIRGTTLNFRDETSAQVIAHWMPWFGTPGHITIGYNSADQSTCDEQVTNMVSQGIAGINVDYYGPTSPSALACIRMLNSCERAGMKYSICVDQGCPILQGLTGNAATAAYISILTFVAEAFFISPWYLQDAGRYVVNFFGEPAGVNWTSVRAGISQKMALLFQGGAGFTHAEADGAYGWINPTTPASNINIPAIQTFNTAAAANPTKVALFPAYSGFDDSMASWGKGRVMSRRLGQTLLDTLALVPKTAKYVIVPTFNDHEEGTSLEYTQG